MARLLAVPPILALLVFAASVAWDVLRTDGEVREASLEMSTWASRPAEATWMSVHDKLRFVSAIRPREPAVHELLGLLLTLRRDDPKLMEQGFTHLARALELRPISAYTWANLMEAGYLRGDPASSLEPSLMRAATLGTAEPGVQRLVVDLGLALWDELRPQAQQQVDRLLVAGLRRNPLEMLRISDRRGRLEAACRHVLAAPGRDPRVNRYCERWEITP